MWRIEKGEAYAVPDVIERHPKLEDVSWHNDACPSFRPKGIEDHEDCNIRLWIEHPDPAQRESGDDGRGRYIVSGADTEDELITFQGDDVAAAIAAVLREYRTWRKANPTAKTRAAEARRKAQRAAEDAAEDAAQAAHARAYPLTVCPERCGACVARIAYGLMIGSEFIHTTKRPWSGRGQSGWEAVTMRCRISHVRASQFDYVALQVLDVADPLPGGAYDGDAWRTRPLTGHQGGMTWSYAGQLIRSLEMRVVE